LGLVFFTRFSIGYAGANGKINEWAVFAVARARNPNREKVKAIWLESGGTASTKELAAAAGVPETRIRKWKCEDKWQEELKTKKRGGQPRNHNAAGHGAPKGSKNAETHGAYSRIHLEALTPEEREYIERLSIDTEENILRELQLLFAKERDLARKLNYYENAIPAELFVDRVVEMLVPKGKEAHDDEIINADAEELKTAMRTVIKASPFDRAMKLEAEYNKTHGRILKLIDTMRAHEIDKRRLDLDERKHSLAKQRLKGAFNIDPETGELNDRDDGAEGIDVD
jgi:uncharacterized protein YjcR